jgi:hypothetical protein
VFGRAHPHRCCTGSLTLLDTTTTPPADFESFDTDGVAVRFHRGASEFPGQLATKLRGMLTRHPVAFWDGCAFKP